MINTLGHGIAAGFMGLQTLFALWMLVKAVRKKSKKTRLISNALVFALMLAIFVATLVL